MRAIATIVERDEVAVGTVRRRYEQLKGSKLARALFCAFALQLLFLAVASLHPRLQRIESALATGTAFAAFFWLFSKEPKLEAEVQERLRTASWRTGWGLLGVSVALALVTPSHVHCRTDGTLEIRGKAVRCRKGEWSSYLPIEEAGAFVFGRFSVRTPDNRSGSMRVLPFTDNVLTFPDDFPELPVVEVDLARDAQGDVSPVAGSSPYALRIGNVEAPIPIGGLMLAHAPPTSESRSAMAIDLWPGEKVHVVVLYDDTECESHDFVVPTTGGAQWVLGHECHISE